MYQAIQLAIPSYSTIKLHARLTCEVHSLADFSPANGKEQSTIVATGSRSSVGFCDDVIKTRQERVERIFVS